jgi:two pore calcium channel protein 3
MEEDPDTVNVTEAEAETGPDFNCDLAATYLDDALSHRHIDFSPTRQGVRLYRLYNVTTFRYLLYAFFVIDVGLAFFEAPAKVGWELPYWVSLVIELTCITFFMGRLFHEMMICVDAKVFWKDTKHITSAVIIGLALIDIVVYLGMREASAASAVRWSRPLRPFLVVNFPEARQIRRAFRNIRRTMPDLANVLILFLSSLALFALMAVKLFQKRGLANGNYFTDFFDAYWDLFVLVTTANSPDIMMPAYDSNRVYIFFFLAFLIVNLYLFMRVFLAVVYNSYKENLKSEVREAVEQKRTLLAKAFYLMKNTASGRLSKENFIKLLQLARPERKAEFWQVTWAILDTGETGHIEVDEFGHIVDLIHMRVVNIKDKRTVWLPHVFYSSTSRKLVRLVRHIYFRYLFDAIILANAIFIAFELDGGEQFFLAVFTLEIVLKLYAFGFKEFARKLWNIFDVVVVGSALLVTVIEAGLQQSHASEVALDFLMVLRVIRIFKIFHTVTRFRIVINTILHILPSMATYGGVLLVFYYFFAIIGMELFGGKIKYYGYNENSQSSVEKYCGDYRLQNSEFYRDRYCSNNFNDLFTSLVTLFQLMVVNQWHVLAQGFVLVTSKVARIYFFLFHFVCVTVILNIFSAFVIEAFILELAVTSGGRQPQSPLTHRIHAMGLGYGKCKTSAPSGTGGLPDEEQLVTSEEEDYVDADHGQMELPSTTAAAADAACAADVRNLSVATNLRFHLTSRSRTVMGLLEKMFESDLLLEKGL